MDDDIRILECAVAAHTDQPVTEDREHLLRLRSAGGIPIIAPAARTPHLATADASNPSGSAAMAGSQAR